MTFDPRAPFAARVAALPRLGLGISTEFGASATAASIRSRCAARAPSCASSSRSASTSSAASTPTRAPGCAAGWPTTYHFLDVNLEERESLSPAWVAAVTRARARARRRLAVRRRGAVARGPARPRPRRRSLPPILCADSAREMADNVRRLREASGFEVLPENPPGARVPRRPAPARLLRAGRRRRGLRAPARRRAPGDLPARDGPRAARRAGRLPARARGRDPRRGRQRVRARGPDASSTTTTRPHRSPTPGRSSTPCCRARRTCARSCSSASATGRTR